MYHNQSRVEKSDGQLRKSGGRSGHNRGFFGSGRGKSGGGSGTAPPHQPPSSSNQPYLLSNRSFKKSGNGQGGQSRMNPISLGSETSAATVTSRAVQNGAHGQAPSQGSSTTPMPSGPKQGDAPVLRTSWAVLKAPSSQSAAGISDPAAPSTPVKEFLPLQDGTKPFALQFGTISPDIVNGLQILARTSSTPPNLDAQNRDQARHDSFRAVPTQPIPSSPNKQLPTARKDVVGVNQSTSAESIPPFQVRREINQQIPTVPVAPPPKSAALPISDVGQNFRLGQGVNHAVLRNPHRQPSNHFVPILSGPLHSLVPQRGPQGGLVPSNLFVPILSGPLQSLVSQGGLVCNDSDADRQGHYNSRGIMLPPQTPLQVMHKAERKYEIGKVSDKEQEKQRQLKNILDKLTPQNFKKLFQQVKEVNIDNLATLSAVTAQIFDKALMEPTLCEMYANLCFHLSGELPDFVENDEKITFKRLLLNKCQEEFERGERAQAEANRVEEEGEIKQSDEEREEKRIEARTRLLGNIRLIGELYKKRMLTERIMHECIKKLLGDYQNPDEEDLEALCKLMSTIGYQIDHAKAKKHMDAYFDVMLKLSTNQKLSSRARFMLWDVIDLRKNRWQQRRKVDGPKKIEEVHRDAAQERQSQTSRLTRGPSMNSASRRGPPVDYGPRGSSVLPSPCSQIGGIHGLPTQTRGYGMQDVRLEDRHPLENRTFSLPLTQRPTDDSYITLSPQGGLTRGMSIRGAISSVPLAETPLGMGDNHRMTSGPNGYSSTPNRIPYSSREYAASRYVPDRLCESLSDQATRQGRNAYVVTRESRVTDRSFDRFTPTAVPAGRSQGSSGGSSSAVSYAKLLAEEVLREKSMSTIREFYSAKDEKEVVSCIKELNSPSFYPSMVSMWVTDSFERKDAERDLLAKLLVNLCKSRDSLLSQVQLTQGFESVLSMLEDAVIDAPRAAEFLGCIFVKVILENVVPLRDIGKLIHEGGEEPGGLIESGLASDVLGSIMEIIKAEKGDSILNEILLSSKLQLGDFRPPHPIKSKKKLDPFLRGSPMSEIKGSSIDVVAISSSINEDEYQEPEDDDEDEAEESGMNRGGNGGDKKGVAGDVRPTSVEVKTGGDKGVDDDDCFILDFDPFDSTAADLKSKLSRVSSGQEEDVSVLAEKGEVACRDFPHPRHACAEFLFDKTPHESFCAQCYCYVCDASAPCAWWKVSSPNSHCHASDQQSLWKNLRSAERLKREVKSNS